MAEKMLEVLTDSRWFGNSSSDSHEYGEAAAGLIETARRAGAAAAAPSRAK